MRISKKVKGVIMRNLCGVIFYMKKNVLQDIHICICTPLSNVINIHLSLKSFTFYEFKLLNKNLNFCPTPNRHKKQFKNEINIFIRKVKLKAHYKNNEQDIENREFRISRNKTWKPRENHHTKETFTQAFQDDLVKEEDIKQIPHKNVSKNDTL